MKLYAGGVVTNEYNQVLFILRSDSRTWAQPGGAVEEDESPTDALEREIEEETGLQVMPVRLVGMYYRPEAPDGALSFTFRCIQRGGELASSEESPHVGFLPAIPLPTPMFGFHRERIERALAHDGGPPYWGRQDMPAIVRLLRPLVYGAKDLLRLIRGQEPFQPPPQWEIAAFVVLHDEEGKVLWVKHKDYDVWTLPGGARKGLEAPWDTAVRKTREETGLDVDLLNCSGVYTMPEKGECVFAFTAETRGGQSRPGPEAARLAYFAPGQEPQNCLPEQVERVADAAGLQQKTRFRTQRGAPGLQALGLA
jgi:ADP-ribose pyrophosphatase YjhB (NUDIX family)